MAGTNPKRQIGIWVDVLDSVRLSWRLFRDKRVPLLVKGIPVASLAYLAWPIDLLADPILGLGQLDDLAVLMLGIKLFVSLCPRGLVNEHLRALHGGRSDPNPEAHETIDGAYRVLEDNESS